MVLGAAIVFGSAAVWAWEEQRIKGGHKDSERTGRERERENGKKNNIEPGKEG